MSVSSIGSINQDYQFFKKPVIAVIAAALVIIASLGLYFLYRAFQSPAARSTLRPVSDPLSLINPPTDYSDTPSISIPLMFIRKPSNGGSVEFFIRDTKSICTFYLNRDSARAIISIENAERFQPQFFPTSIRWLTETEDNRCYLIDENGETIEHENAFVNRRLDGSEVPIYAVADLRKLMDTYQSTFIIVDNQELPRVVYERAQQSDVDRLEVLISSLTPSAHDLERQVSFFRIVFKDEGKIPLEYHIRHDGTIDQREFLRETSNEDISWTWKNTNQGDS